MEQKLGAGMPMKISMDQLKASKEVICDCGGAMFTEKLMFKKISAILSPTAKEEVYPMQVIVCDSCGKVPTEFNPYDLIPKKYLATKK